MAELKRGRKKEMSKELAMLVRCGLVEWRHNELLDEIYLGTSIIAGETLLGDDVIEKLVACGIRIESGEELRQHARWFLAFDKMSGKLTTHGKERLQQIYSNYDNMQPNENTRELVNSEVSPLSFYCDPQKLRGQGRGRGRPRGSSKR